jgi:hypothetical protein
MCTFTDQEAVSGQTVQLLPKPLVHINQEDPLHAYSLIIKKSFRSLPSSKSTRLAKRLSERPRLYLPLLRGRKQEDFI